MATIRDIVFDCRHPAGLARFWAGALDGYEIAPYDADELHRLHEIGIDDVEDDPTVLVESADAPVRLWFQRVPEDKVVKNRVHLDLAAEDPAAEIRRLIELGATTAPEQRCPGLTVMHDPEGNELCVLDRT